MPTLIFTRVMAASGSMCMRCDVEVPGYRVSRIMEALERQRRYRKIVAAGEARNKKKRAGGWI